MEMDGSMVVSTLKALFFWARLRRLPVWWLGFWLGCAFVVGCSDDDPVDEDNPSPFEEMDDPADSSSGYDDYDDGDGDDDKTAGGGGSGAGGGGGGGDSSLPKAPRCSETQAQFNMCFGHCMRIEGADRVQCEEDCQLCEPSEDGDPTEELFNPFSRTGSPRFATFNWLEHACVKATLPDSLCVASTLTLMPRMGNYHDRSTYYNQRGSHYDRNLRPGGPGYYKTFVHLRDEYLHLDIRSVHTSKPGKRHGFKFYGKFGPAIKAANSTAVAVSSEVTRQKYNLYLTVYRRSENTCHISFAILTPLGQQLKAYYKDEVDCR